MNRYLCSKQKFLLISLTGISGRRAPLKTSFVVEGYCSSKYSEVINLRDEKDLFIANQQELFLASDVVPMLCAF